MENPSAIFLPPQATNALYFDVGTTKFCISEPGIVIGIDDEGIPSLGFAATFDINQIDVSAAVFIDSATPTQGVFATALSGFSLLGIATCIAHQSVQAVGRFVGMTNSTMPSYFAPVLKQFKLSGTRTFMVSDRSQTLQSALDNGDLKTIANAFASSPYHIALPTTHDKVLLDVDTPGTVSYITDLTTRLHYSLRSTMSSIAVSLEPQLYYALQDSNVGGLDFPKGFYVHGKLDLLLLHAEVNIDIEYTGLTAEIDVDPVVLLERQLLRDHRLKRQGWPPRFHCHYNPKRDSGPYPESAADRHLGRDQKPCTPQTWPRATLRVRLNLPTAPRRTMRRSPCELPASPPTT